MNQEQINKKIILENLVSITNELTKLSEIAYLKKIKDQVGYSEKMDKQIDRLKSSITDIKYEWQ